jgi:hypothetical protein
MVSTIGRNLNLRPIMLAAICRDLFRFEPILLVRYRWPQPQASEDAPMGAWTWPNEPGPPEKRKTPWGRVCGPQPEFIQRDFAAILFVVSSCNFFETKFKNV